MRVICDMATGSINSSAKPITARPSTISGMDDDHRPPTSGR